jgi:hypothetical protein
MEDPAMDARLRLGARHRGFVFQHAAKLLSQLWRVLLTVHRGGVLGDSPQDVVLFMAPVHGGLLYRRREAAKGGQSGREDRSADD